MFRNSNDNNRVDDRLLVNGQEYTTVESIVYGSGGGNGGFNDSVRKTSYLKDIFIVNPCESAVLSLEIRVWDNDFRVYEAFVPTGSFTFYIHYLALKISTLLFVDYSLIQKKLFVYINEQLFYFSPLTVRVKFAAIYFMSSIFLIS